jgi:ABC-type sugar transport system permease subunit
MVRHGAAALEGIPAAQQEAARIDIAAAFRGVFLTVACFSCTIVACAATLPLRRL